MYKTKVGIIGCGNICDEYLEGSKFFHQYEITACADILKERSDKMAEKYGIKAMTVDEILADPDIEIIINITVPKVHGLVDRQILEAGKHVFSEKPLGVDLEEGKSVLALAKEKGLKIGCAPDTFLAAGIQTSLKILRDGWIGDIVAVNANFIGGSPMGWHPNPDSFFQKGSGPMLDMGPYYVTALVALFGPIRKVTGVSFSYTKKKTVTFPIERIGEFVDVEVPLHNNAIYEFESGLKCNFTCSFDVIGGTKSRPFEVYGTKGTLFVPDPNHYASPVILRMAGQEERIMPFSHGFTEDTRGLGVADLAASIQNNREPRSSGELACHVLDALTAVYRSSDLERPVELTTACRQPDMVPDNLLKGFMD